MYKISAKSEMVPSGVCPFDMFMRTTIFRRRLTNLGLLLLLFEFINFSFLIKIIDNIINTSISHAQNSHQWQCSIFVTCFRLYHVTSKLHCLWWKCWSHVTDVLIILSILSIKNGKWLNSNNNRSKSKFVRFLWDIVVFRLVA